MKHFYFICFLSVLVSGWVYGKPLAEVGGESPPLFWEASVEVEGEKVYLITQYTIGDGVTSLSCTKTPVPISPRGVQMINYDNDWLIVANEDYHYYIWGYHSEEAKVIPLFPTREVSEVIARGHIYFTQGTWYYLDYAKRSSYEDPIEITKEVLTDFPTQDVVVLHTSETKTLLKDTHKVYMYREEGYMERSIEVVEGLDAQKVCWVEGSYGSYGYLCDYLYDEDTFYITEYNFPRLNDYTENFTREGFTQKFTEGTFVRYGQKTHNKGAFWDFHDGRLWFCEGFAIIPREDITYEASLDLLQKDGKYYRDYSHYYHRDSGDYNRPIDLSAVKNPQQLRIIETPKKSSLSKYLFYYDGISYYVVYENRFFPMEISPLQEKILSASERYNTTHTGNEFVLIDGKMVFYYLRWIEDIKGFKNRPFCPIKVTRELPLSSPVRDIGFGYVTQDWLILGQHCVKNLTDYQSLSFVGATKDMTLYLSYKAAPTYYYFKDKNRKYCYKYTDKKLSLVSEEKDVCNRVKSEK